MYYDFTNLIKNNNSILATAYFKTDLKQIIFNLLNYDNMLFSDEKSFLKNDHWLFEYI